MSDDRIKQALSIFEEAGFSYVKELKYQGKLVGMEVDNGGLPKIPCSVYIDIENKEVEFNSSNRKANIKLIKATYLLLKELGMYDEQ